ncbi:MAG: hypothetical protein ACOX2J_01715 [Bacillota bacterium]|jgi:hypothetical protein
MGDRGAGFSFLILGFCQLVAESEEGESRAVLDGTESRAEVGNRYRIRLEGHPGAFQLAGSVNRQPIRPLPRGDGEQGGTAEGTPPLG